MFELNNGYKIPVIGYGTFPQKETLEWNVPIAYKAGYRLIDTSDNYFNEEFVGKGLLQTDAADLTIITKFSQPMRTESLEKCFEDSFTALHGGGIEGYICCIGRSHTYGKYNGERWRICICQVNVLP